jgi:tripartite-type tricarboxylate transporter receptor subunit TctC
MSVPDAAKLFASVGVEVSLSTPEEMTRYMIEEPERWGKVVKEAGISID